MAGEGYGQELISGLTVSSPFPRPAARGRGRSRRVEGVAWRGWGWGGCLSRGRGLLLVCFLPRRADRPAVCQSLWSDFTRFPPFLLGLPPSF